MKQYRAAFSMGMLGSLEYRFDFFVGLIGVAYPIVIQVFLWLAIYGGSSETQLYGYTFPGMMTYVIAASFVGRLVDTGVEYAINEDIHSGGLARYLVKPMAYIPFRMAYTIGSRLMQLCTLLLLAGAAVTVLHFGAGFQPEAERVALFLPALFLGFWLNFFVFFLVSMLGFWLTEVGSFFMTIQVVIMVVSGGLFPITVLGDGFVRVMRWLPFIYTTYFPLNVLTGQESSLYAVTGLGIQAVWIAALAALSVWVWKRGIRRYVAVGG